MNFPWTVVTPTSERPIVRRDSMIQHFVWVRQPADYVIASHCREHHILSYGHINRYNPFHIDRVLFRVTKARAKKRKYTDNFSICIINGIFPPCQDLPILKGDLVTLNDIPSRSHSPRPLTARPTKCQNHGFSPSQRVWLVCSRLTAGKSHVTFIVGYI